MSGHSKWATTKHRKAAVDAKRAKAFAKYIKVIEVAARGGTDGNPALELAVAKAKKNSVPNDNIERAIRRGSGQDGDAADYQTIMYEGYGPAGTAIYVECLTDNRNRSASETRVAFTRNGATMADPGSVAYLFSRKGVTSVDKKTASEDDVLAAVLEAGVEEITDQNDSFQIVCDPGDLPAVRKALEEAGIDYNDDDVVFLPASVIELDVEDARKFLRIYDALEELDDVQNIYSNADMTAEVSAQLAKE